MPEEKKAAEKTEKAKKNAQPGKLNKILQWFATLPQRIAKPFKNMYYELKKVTWPTKQKLINYSVIVLAFMLVMGVVIGLLDMGASAAVRMLIPKSSSSVTTTADTTEEAEETAEEAEETAEEAAETAEAAEETAETGEQTAEETAETADQTTEEPAEETAETGDQTTEEPAETDGNTAEETAETADQNPEETAETAEDAASGEK